ncbi:hypothetical protein BDN71DRAFT_1437578, partial [Pleurotus eryngii]
MFGVVPEASKDGGHGSGWSSCDEHRGIALSSFTKGALTVADTGKFSVLPGLRRCEHSFKLLKEGAPSGRRLCCLP